MNAPRPSLRLLPCLLGLGSGSDTRGKTHSMLSKASKPCAFSKCPAVCHQPLVPVVSSQQLARGCPASEDSLYLKNGRSGCRRMRSHCASDLALQLLVDTENQQESALSPATRARLHFYQKGSMAWYQIRATRRNGSTATYRKLLRLPGLGKSCSRSPDAVSSAVTL
eukprot:353449-Chlamydomonas_euryale.AAC.10